MNLLNAPMSLGLALLGWALFVPALVLALRASRTGGFLREGGQQHAWFAGVVGIAFLWTLQVNLGDGPAFGMLGTALFVLLFGWARAIVGLLAALVLHTWIADGTWLGLGFNGLLFALLPALITTSLQRALARWLPHNIFIFIIGNGMFVTLVATAATSVMLLIISLGVAASPAASLHIGEYLGYALLMAWGESLVSGMIFSSLVIFTPSLVLTYSQDRYLPGRGR